MRGLPWEWVQGLFPPHPHPESQSIHVGRGGGAGEGSPALGSHLAHDPPPTLLQTPGNYTLQLLSGDRFVVKLEGKWLLMREASTDAWRAEVQLMTSGEGRRGQP